VGVGEGHGVKVCYDLRLRTSSSCKAVFGGFVFCVRSTFEFAVVISVSVPYQ